MRSDVAVARDRPAPGAFRSDAVSLLLSRVSDFASVFQPVVSLAEGRAIGFEALLRLPKDLLLNNPVDAFAAVTGTPALVDLEIAALETHLAFATELPEGRLFLNLSPTALLDPRFLSLIHI